MLYERKYGILNFKDRILKLEATSGHSFLEVGISHKFLAVVPEAGKGSLHVPQPVSPWCGKYVGSSLLRFALQGVWRE